MDIKDLCEHTRIRLIAAVVGHQQCTKTASNIVPIPGGDRVIAIGTPAQARALLTVDKAAAQRAGTGPVETWDAVVAIVHGHMLLADVTTAQKALMLQMLAGLDEYVKAAVLATPAPCGASGAGSDQVDSERGHHD